MNNNMREKNSFLKIYKKKMDKIEFMHQYKDDPDIFNPDSIRFKNFLINSFAHLQSDFHYLEFLNKEDIIQELVKVSGILQILSVNPSANKSKFFDCMSETEIHKFWLRFLSLFERKEQFFKVDYSFSCLDNMDFFKLMNSTLNYLNHDFPAISLTKIKNVNLNLEIDKWKEYTTGNNCAPVSIDSTIINPGVDLLHYTNKEKLIADIKHVVSTYNNINLPTLENKSAHLDFFVDFTKVTGHILKYRDELNIIDSVVINNIYSLLKTEKDSVWLGNIYFMKRYNNLIKLLKSKFKLIE